MMAKTVSAIFLGLLFAIGGCSDTSTRRAEGSHTMVSGGLADNTGSDVSANGFSIDAEFAYQTEQCAGLNNKFNCALRDELKSMSLFVGTDEVRAYTGSAPNFTFSGSYPFSGRNKKTLNPSSRNIKASFWAERRENSIILRELAKADTGKSDFSADITYIFTIQDNKCDVRVQDDTVDVHRTDERLSQSFSTKSTETTFCEITAGNRFI